MGNIGFIALRPLGLALKDAFHIRHFVETGTYRCRTTVWAAENFEAVTTIEGYAEYYQHAANSLGKVPNIRLIYGSSAEKLAGALPDEPALIWLDAHWMGNTDESRKIPGGECPLREELQAIRDGGVRHYIFIDDARLFTARPAAPHDPKQWPRLAEIKALLPPGYFVTIWEDAIIAVPDAAASVVRRFTGDAPSVRVSVLTSNGYLNVVPGFEYLFNRFWPGQPATIVRYEVKPAKLYPHFGSHAIGNQADYTWSSGLMAYLDCYAGDLLVLMLEDYYLARDVDVRMMATLWDVMERVPEIAKIDLAGEVAKYGATPYKNCLLVADDEAPWQTSLQAAIWRVDFLRRFLNESENPWQFEKKGSARVIRARKSGKFDGLVLGVKEPELVYINAVGGEGNKPGEFDLKKFPPWMVYELKGKGLL